MMPFEMFYPNMNERYSVHISNGYLFFYCRNTHAHFVSIDSPFFAHIKPILNPFMYQISFWYNLGSFLVHKWAKNGLYFALVKKWSDSGLILVQKCPVVITMKKRQPFYKLSLIYKEYLIMENLIKGQSQYIQTYQ